MFKSEKYKKIKTEYIGKLYALICAMVIIILTLSIIFFIGVKGSSLFIKGNYTIKDFLLSTKWNPDSTNPQFGAAIFITGSILVSIGAVIISTPIGLAIAIFMNYISPKVGKNILQPALELFVGIPSVVYGWIGIKVLIPFIKLNFSGIGFSLIAGILVLSIMVMPTIASLSYDTLKSIPKYYLEASYALGGTRWQTIRNVIIPAGKSGILTAIVLGLARAFGEALAVQMVIGNAIKMPEGLLDPTSTLTSILTMDMANTVTGTPWNDALWALALILLIVSFIFIFMIRIIAKRGEAR
ncbi:phosphate ABC transporter permease subunit PstC [Clostridium rectalis]|uniref:phosphate ABC transporter permease subunit PstC n=1 Tax=Clostridium rectalis TaxID=2040295 RepID=UPI000F63EBB1|nr:phosphate ABC transporter permease subunit PstC [Clostridium rectalis]